MRGVPVSTLDLVCQCVDTVEELQSNKIHLSLFNIDDAFFLFNSVKPLLL